MPKRKVAAEGQGTEEPKRRSPRLSAKPVVLQSEPKTKKAAAPKKMNTANDKKEIKGKKVAAAAKAKVETKQEEVKEENHSENGETQTNEVPIVEEPEEKAATSE